jgi:hypothetical protein
MRNFNFSVKEMAAVAFFVLLAIYALFQARFLILGPLVYIDHPLDGELVRENVIIVEGRAQNIAYISMNGRPIFIESNGKWGEKYVVSNGLNVITIEAKDRFGRRTEKEVRVVYK